MEVFNKSKWIWYKKENTPDDYGEFFEIFEAKSGQNVACRLSCDGDYTLFVNGNFVESNQYGDFEHYKIYDEIDISDFIIDGKNSISLLVWHFGCDNQRYKKYTQGLIFEVVSESKILAASAESTKSRKSLDYECGRCGIITAQLGYGFHYDARRADGSLFTGENFGQSILIDKTCTFYKRPTKKLCIAERKQPKEVTVSEDKKHFLIDLGEETVGLLTMKFDSPKEQKILIAWGEHLRDGHVSRIIGARDFSVEYTAKIGKNNYTNYMLRLGVRYLEVWCESPLKTPDITLLPQYYPVKAKKASLENSLDQRIYDLCANTLKLSMMEHYVDCPWREQALYVYDSRNQMLSGYYAFKDKNAEYARANLKLISMDRREENELLSICYPTGRTLSIPSFCLHYYTSVWEYFENVGDKELLSELYPKLLSLIKEFRNNKKDGLVCRFGGQNHWNFYDWTEYVSATPSSAAPIVNEIPSPDSIINLLYINALDKLEKICGAIGEEFPYPNEADAVRTRVLETYFNEDDGAFFFKDGGDYTMLANSLAILTDTATGDNARKICEKMISGDMVGCTLSMKSFLYDALLKTDEKYKDFILSEIRKNYNYMLNCGATSAWETIKGAEDFDGAGSLCHGWSAVPIYYYHKFGMVK